MTKLCHDSVDTSGDICRPCVSKGRGTQPSAGGGRQGAGCSCEGYLGQRASPGLIRLSFFTDQLRHAEARRQAPAGPRACGGVASKINTFRLLLRGVPARAKRRRPARAAAAPRGASGVLEH